jgi:hypothetical protein
MLAVDPTIGTGFQPKDMPPNQERAPVDSIGLESVLPTPVITPSVPREIG